MDDLLWQMTQANVAQYVEEMRSCIESAGYAGYDPYDALNSPLIRLCCGRSKWSRIAATQFLKWCPLNVRPLLGIRRGHNPKAIGLFLGAYSRLYALKKDSQCHIQIEYLLSLLEKLRSSGYSGDCWGYNFDWQSRTVFRPKWTPTIVNTSFIGHALLDCYEMTGTQRALDVAATIPEFVLSDLHRTVIGDTLCFSYTPVDREVIHNANLLGASLLVRLARYKNDPRLTTAALSSLAYSMRRQRSDGSWYYADTPDQRWIDSFHTGFNLKAIRYFLRAGLAREYVPAYHAGVRYYKDKFFLTDGAPKYYNDGLYPMDIHAPAQAVSFFAYEGGEYDDLTERILAWMLRHMYRGNGCFCYRRGRFLTNRIVYMRWSQAWAFSALVDYLYAKTGRRSHDYEHKTDESVDSRRTRELFPLVQRGH